MVILLSTAVYTVHSAVLYQYQSHSIYVICMLHTYCFQYNAVSKNRYNAHFGLRTCCTIYINIALRAQAKNIRIFLAIYIYITHTHTYTNSSWLLVRFAFFLFFFCAFSTRFNFIICIYLLVVVDVVYISVFTSYWKAKILHMLRLE